MWSTVVYEEEKTSPCSRSKHSVTLLGNHLYLLAGRNVNVPLKDFWRFDLGTNKWELLKPHGDPPPSLQEHTAVTFRESIYVFGGELGFSGGNETPLWIYESKKNFWRKIKGQKGANIPKGRRGHTTLVHRGSAFIYGGYCDLRGSSNELWIFHFDTESWHLIIGGRNDPPARHKHSAVIHDDSMWIYGGMTDLQERSDLWRFDVSTKKWASIKCKYNPGPLHSHAACKLPSSMILFGGERNGQLVNELWRFHFGTETWQRIRTDVISPQPVSECCAVTISELLLQGVNSDRCRESSSPPSARPHNSPFHSRKENCSPEEWKKLQRCSSNRNGNVNGNCVTRQMDCSFTSAIQNVMIPPRRQATTPNSCNLSFLKEISKLSQMNLSRLTQNGRCSYHVLGSNESIQFEETSNDELNRGIHSNNEFPLRPRPLGRSTNGLWRDTSSLVNTPLTPSDAAKLVYLEGEEAPISSVISSNVSNLITGEEFSAVHQRLHPRENRNRRSYPLTNSVRFANPLVTPEEPSPDITSDYASCENIHKLLSSNNRLNTSLGEKAKTPNKDSVISFSNPNYCSSVQQQMVYVEEKISRGDYVKLNSPADSLLEDSSSSADNKYEMTELRPKPPKSLPLSCDIGRNNGNNDCGGIIISEKRRKYRACSAGRCDRQQSVNSLCVFLIGGKDHCQLTTFKKPISVWKLSLTKDIY